MDDVLHDSRALHLKGLKAYDTWDEFGEVVLKCAPLLPNLTYISVCEMETERLPLREILEAFPGAERVLFENCAGRIEPARHLCLRDLMLETCRRDLLEEVSPEEMNGLDYPRDLLDVSKLQALSTSVLPELEELTLSFQGQVNESEAEVEAILQQFLPPILTRQTFPNLRMLRFVGHPAGEVIQVVATVIVETELDANLKKLIFAGWGRDIGMVKERWGSKVRIYR